MDEEEVLSLERRRRVYHAVRAHPGLHLRALERELDISLGDLRYHLEYLEKRGLVTSASDGYRRTYFSARDVYLGDRAVLALLRQRAPRTIILHLMLHEASTFEAIRQALGVSKSTLSFHLGKLTARGLLTTQRVEGRNAYRLVNREEVANLLVTYRQSFLDAAIDRVLEVWFP